MALKLKRSTTASGAKVKRSNEFKATVLVNKNSGMSGKEALLSACEEFSLEAVDSFRNHPHTFTSGYEKAIGKIVEDAAHPEHAAIVEILRDGGMITETDGEAEEIDEPIEYNEFEMTNDSDVPDYEEAIDGTDQDDIETS